MKKVFLATASIAAGLIGGQALAASGYVGGKYIDQSVDTPLGDAEGNGWGVDGSHSFATGPGMGFAVDASYADAEDADAILGGAAHLFSLSESSLIGAYVATVDLDSGGMTWGVGGEFQSFLDSATLGVAAGYETNDTLDASGFAVNGAGRFFVNDNFAIGGALGYHALDFSGTDTNAVTYGVNAEFQITGAPISLTAGFSRTTWDDIDTDVDTLSVGARYTWGGTLKERDRNGGSLAGLNGVGNLIGF